MSFTYLLRNDSLSWFIRKFLSRRIFPLFCNYLYFHLYIQPMFLYTAMLAETYYIYSFTCEILRLLIFDIFSFCFVIFQDYDFFLRFMKFNLDFNFFLRTFHIWLRSYCNCAKKSDYAKKLSISIYPKLFSHKVLVVLCVKIKISGDKIRNETIKR